MIGRQVSHFRIVEQIGVGGMGVVYKARDLALERFVALKFLPESLSLDETRKMRFVQEAKAASALDHPNICTIHEIGETETGQMYMCMPYYEGETLHAVARRGELTAERIVDLLTQVARGLSSAHRLGIVHRDIKTANIIVTLDNLAKVLDFGLAKLALPDSDLTVAGSIMGTPAYMSPEQIGGGNVDHRADIWSLGIVSYEVVTGTTPFHGNDPMTLLYAILNNEPSDDAILSARNGSVFAPLIRKCLQKDPALRFQTLDEYIRALAVVNHAIAEGRGPEDPTLTFATSALKTRERAVLVLPFDHMSGEEDRDHFSDGLTEEVITDLSGIEALRVIARTSAMQLRGTSKDLKTLARELNVQYVLEGSVRRIGSKLRVTARLVDAGSESQIWAEKYSGTVDDVFEIQETISRQIVHALEVTLSPAEDEKLDLREIENAEAYEYYLRAKQQIMRCSKESLERAMEFIEHGRSLIGENILLNAALGYAHWQMANAGAGEPDKHLPIAEDCARKIFQEVPDSPHGNRLMGLVQAQRGNGQAVIHHLKKAIEGDPSDTDSLFWIVIYYGLVGQVFHGRPLARRLLEIDPLTPLHQCAPGFLALMNGEFNAASEPFRQSLRMDPVNPIIRETYGQILALNDRVAEATEVFERLHTEMPDSFFARLGRLFSLALNGRREEALALDIAELVQVAQGDPQYPWNLAECFAMLGETERSLDMLEIAVNNGFLNYPLLSVLDPLLDSVRGEPRFKKLMEALKPRWEALQ